MHNEIEELFRNYPELKEKQKMALLKLSLYAQHEAISHLLREEIISNEVAEKEQDIITNKIVELEDGH